MPSVKDMPWEDMRLMIRAMSQEIARLAARGDKQARAVVDAYRYAYDHPRDARANNNLRAAFADYMNRDLRVDERLILGSRYNHRTDLVEKEETRIFVPGKIQ